ncbi:sugar phosphate isomerase/epimerase family protein [Luteolibacter sp. Populi]|uniref:sugar phosphate isomerase/epimerase family protein n=1 Tax=Luteolibacter sp. Populi TaxID=3230487 RepID=UPI003465F5A9
MFRWLVLMISLFATSASRAVDTALLQRENLVAWCIVPFDVKKRGPEERAVMLERLGIHQLAYDWRDEHVAGFDAEVEAMQRHKIAITAWWMPGVLDGNSRKIIEVIRRHGIHPQWWVLIGEPLPGNPDQEAKLRAAAEQLRPLVLEARALGCKVALYNHGGWFGEPRNQIAIIRALDSPEVGMVYNFHHGHAHVADFPRLFDEMKPHLLALNLNGMVDDADQKGLKIMPPGKGEHEAAMLRHVLASGWKGPVGILSHLPETDAEVTLRTNLEALEALRLRLE